MLGPETADEWVGDLLAIAAAPTAGLLRRSRLSVEPAALIQGEIRKMRLGVGVSIQPVGVREFLVDLGRSTGSALESVASWADLTIEGGVDQAFASGWGRLASALRLRWDEAWMLLRISLLRDLVVPVGLVDVRGSDPLSQDPMGVLQGRAIGLDLLVESLPAEQRDLFEEARRAARDAYSSEGN